MVEIPVDPSRQSLTDEEVKNIKKELIKIDFIMTKYARERKFRVDSQVVGQNFGIISFKPSRGAKPDKRGCFGVIKLRGNYASTAEADKRSDQLISEDDNLDIDMPFIGREFPLMLNNEVYTHSIRDVDTSKTITDSTSSLVKEKEEKDAKEAKEGVEITEEKNVKDEKDKKEEKSSLREKFSQWMKSDDKKIIENPDELLKKKMEEMSGHMLSVMWHVTELDIRSTLAKVCKKVTHDHSVDEATRIKRKNALKILGEAFIKNGVPYEKGLHDIKQRLTQQMMEAQAHSSDKK
jgi:hypothetical protein